MQMSTEETRSLIESLMGRKSVGEFAREIGASPQAVYNWLNGAAIPSPVFQKLLIEYGERNNIEMPRFA